MEGENMLSNNIEEATLDAFEIEEEEDITSENFMTSLLFCIQNIGSHKTINGMPMYLKGTHCDDCLREIHKKLRNDNPENPIVRLQLLKWNLACDDLLQLIITQKKDRKLAFFIIIILVDLTEPISQDCIKRQEIKEQLTKFKECFLGPGIVETINTHLAECITKAANEKHERHDQMIELIMALYKNTLLIEGNELQRKLIFEFARASVFDALVYLSQEFNTPLSVKLSITFLEIFNIIYRQFDIENLINYDKSSIKALFEEDKAKKKASLQGLSSRHGKFNTCVAVKRSDNTSFIISNVFQPIVDPAQKLASKSRPQPRKFNKIRGLIGPPDYLNTSNVSEEDTQLGKIMLTFVVDFMEHSFSPLIECTYNELYRNTERVDEEDKEYFISLCTFIVNFCRIRSTKSPAEFPLAKGFLYIGAALQISTLEYIYGVTKSESLKKKKKEYRTYDYYSGIKYLLAVLNMYKELKKIPETEANANIIEANFMHKDIINLCRAGFTIFNYKIHNKIMLTNLIEFAHLYLNSLENYGKGKSFFIEVNSKKVVRKRSKDNVEDAENEKMADFIEKDENEVNNEQESVSQSDKEEEDEIINERPLYFENELSALADYNVVSCYCLMLSDREFVKNTMTSYISNFFCRLLNQIKASWIFFQMEYLTIFYDILHDKSITSDIYYHGLLTTIKDIIKQYFEAAKKNSLLHVESMFRYPNRILKEEILSNYELSREAPQQQLLSSINQTEEEPVVWTEEEDQIIIDNYPHFKDLPNRLDLLRSLIKTKKDLSQIKERIDFLHIVEGVSKAQIAFNQIHNKKREFNYEKLKECVALLKISHLEVLNFLKSQFTKYLEFLNFKEAYMGEEAYNEGFAIVPIDESEFIDWSAQEFHELKEYMNIDDPKQGQCYYRIPSYLKAEDINKLVELIA